MSYVLSGAVIPRSLDDAAFIVERLDLPFDILLLSENCTMLANRVRVQLLDVATIYALLTECVALLQCLGWPRRSSVLLGL